MRNKVKKIGGQSIREETCSSIQKGEELNV
jgi:hypothetical protein